MRYRSHRHSGAVARIGEGASNDAGNQLLSTCLYWRSARTMITRFLHRDAVGVVYFVQGSLTSTSSARE